MKPKVTCQVRIMVGPGGGLGPGKAALLRAIQETRSINAAGKRFGMSYRRAWLLVSEMNGLFRKPVVIARRGGVGGGGAEITALGKRVLAAYEAIETRVSRSRQVRTLVSLMGDIARNGN